MISILRDDERPRPRATERRAVAIADAEKSKRVRNPELNGGGRYKLISFAIEVHGRWSKTATYLIHELAKWKAASSPTLLRRSMRGPLVRSMDCAHRMRGAESFYSIVA